MDIVLEVTDTYLFDRMYAYLLPAYTAQQAAAFGSNATLSGIPVPLGYEIKPSSALFHLEATDFAYMSQWSRNNPLRQYLSLFLISWLFGAVMYFFFATASFYLVFDKATFKHPKYLKNQIPMEIQQTLKALPVMAIFTSLAFYAEVRGWSKLYDTSADGPGLWYDILQFPFFLLFTDAFIYWIHRGLHHPLIYKHLHKSHHKWIVPTPFASHAFHPMDGFAQSIPYHVFPFLFPLNKFAYIALFTFVNIWTVMIHDGEYAHNSLIINGAACHTMHHLYFNYNYGQYTTLWDRLGGSYRRPNEELFRKEEKMSKAEWERQTKEAEQFITEVEGDDDRVFLSEAKKEQ